MKNEDGYVAITPAVTAIQATKGIGKVSHRMSSLILSWSVTMFKLQVFKRNKDLRKKDFTLLKTGVYWHSIVQLCENFNRFSVKFLCKPHDERFYQIYQNCQL